MTYDIIVVGAGPVGLTAATSFARDGHNVTVLERHPALQAPGGPLIIQSAASRLLFHLGAQDILEKSSFPMDRLQWWSYKEDQPLADTAFSKGSRTGRHRVNRPLIQQIMYTIATEAGVKVVFGKNVEKLADDGGKPRVWTQDGEEWSADLIVGADGGYNCSRKESMGTGN